MKNPIFIRILCRLNIPPRPFLLCIFDLIALLGTAITMLSFRHIWGGIDLTLSQCTLVLLLLGPFFAATLGLYHTVDLPPHLELKALFTLATSVYAIILAVLFLTKTGDLFSRLTIIGGWGLTIITLPLMRWLCRRIFSRAKWWATTLVILDKDGQGQNMFDYFSKLYGIDKEEAFKRKKKLFERFGINNFAETKISHLSTGMKQKVSIVISLVNDPKILIYDDFLVRLVLEV